MQVFSRHPRSVGETYLGHARTAGCFGSAMIVAGAACLVHALLPFLFETTASRCVSGLHDQMRRRAEAGASGIDRRVLADDKPSPLAGLAMGALAAAAMALGARTRCPPALIALVIGLTVACTPTLASLRAGARLWARQGMRLGVALLGAGISTRELMALGPSTLAAAGGIVAVGVSSGLGLGVLLGMPLAEACVAASAVSICGAAAAIAVAEAMPSSAKLADRTGFVVVLVNILSTAAMLAYPLLTHWRGLGADQAGVFLGLSIHDVAQAVGAGEDVSAGAAHVAALAKLSRVIWLAPAVLLLGLLVARRERSGEGPRTLAPPCSCWGSSPWPQRAA